MADVKYIFVNQTSNTTVAVTSEKLDTVNRRFGTLWAVGVFGGASVQFNISPDGVNWVSAGAALTANGYVNIPANCCFVEAILTGATGTTNVTASLI